MISLTIAFVRLYVTDPPVLDKTNIVFFHTNIFATLTASSKNTLTHFPLAASEMIDLPTTKPTTLSPRTTDHHSLASLHFFHTASVFIQIKLVCAVCCVNMYTLLYMHLRNYSYLALSVEVQYLWHLVQPLLRYRSVCMHRGRVTTEGLANTSLTTTRLCGLCHTHKQTS